jgi:hypothetical protein
MRWMLGVYNVARVGSEQRGRSLLALLCILLIAAGIRASGAAESDQTVLLDKAYEYGFPIVEEARLVYLYSYSPQNPQRVPVNSFGHRRMLADATARTVTTPNNDTLYSSAIIDVSAGPVRLDVPEFGARYFSITFIDAYTNNFAHLGSRTEGSGRSYLVAGPAWKDELPEGVRLIRAPSNHIVAIARILVDGPTDYAAVHRLQDGLQLTSTAIVPERYKVIQPKPDDAENFVAILNQVLRDDPPPAADEPIVSALAAVGVGPSAAPLTEAQRALWTQRLPLLRAKLIAASKQIGMQIHGWEYTPANIGNFGTDYRTRALVAVQGILADIPAEITYAAAIGDQNGLPLDGSKRYRVHLPAGAPPSAGFWSVSAYEVTRAGALYFGENPIHRYAVSDRTQGLTRNADGSLDILVQKNSPSPSHEANWLPIPAQNFVLIARVYLPGPALRDGSFRFPGLEPLD